jgi:hypothetical protein
METKKSIIISTHGEYYYKSAATKGKKPFTQIVKVPDMEFFRQTAVRYIGTDDDGKAQYKETSFLNVRGMIKKKLLPLLLPNKYSDFVRVRSVTIDEIVASDGEVLDLPVQLMSRTQLVQLCKNKKIPIDAVNYLNIDELRTDIIEYQENPDIFLQTLEKRTKKRLEEKKFLELNDLAPAEEAAKPKKNTTKKKSEPKQSDAPASGIFAE